MRTSDLKGAALDWAVAKCENPEWSDEDAIVNVTTFDDYDGTICNYSTDWAQGGPIIERELIGLEFDGAENFKWWGYDPKADNYVHGETPLIAAMRAFVASKLGEFVDIPEELT